MEWEEANKLIDELGFYIAENTPEPERNQYITAINVVIETLEGCRDHWKISFDHERERAESAELEVTSLQSKITTLTQERDAANENLTTAYMKGFEDGKDKARKVIGKIRALCDDWNNLARDTEPTMDCVGKVIEEADL